MYDGNYPQYQFASGGLMQALSPNQAAFDPKFMQDSFLQKLLQEQTKQQIMNAFVPQQGGSFLEQIMNSNAPIPAAPPAPQPVVPPVPQPNPVQVNPKKRRATNDMQDRYGRGFL